MTTAAHPAWKRKDLLALRDLENWEIELVLETAAAFKEVLGRSIKKVPSLRGKTVINLFVEPSTRTRASFELAASRLSADVLSLDSDRSSFTKGETLKDTAKNLEAMGTNVVILRHAAAGAAQFLAERLESSVINAGDGAHEHPTQGLLDLFTIRSHFPDLKGKKVAIIGDILFSRVARSNIWALLKYGAEVTLVGPTTLLPEVLGQFEVNGNRAKLSHSIDDVLAESHVLMLLRIQHERQQKTLFPSLGEYTALFGLTADRFKRCRPDVMIMHPGPINRGVEIDSGVADCKNSVILEQVANGLAVRMAVLYLLTGGQGPQGVSA